MNLNKLFETQRNLDARIEMEHPLLEGEDRLSKKILALQVELGELANEWRGFKFWSKDQGPRVSVICNWCKGNGFIDNFEPFGEGHSTHECDECDGTGKENRNPLIEEYVDCFHFILSIGLDFNINLSLVERELNDFGKWDVIEKQFTYLFFLVSSFPYTTQEEVTEKYYLSLMTNFVGLGEMLGFTWEQIEEAYYVKNSINHERQNAGY